MQRTLRAVAVIFLWLRMLRVLLMHSTYGPFVLMIIEMITDVRKYMVILLLVVLAWASAFYCMYEHSPLYRVAETRGWPMLGAAPTCIDMMHTYPTALVYLLENSLTGGDFFECIRDSSNPVGGWLLAATFYATAVLLLLNMLIAMMAKTFENIAEASAVNFNLLLAQVCDRPRSAASPRPPMTFHDLP